MDICGKSDTSNGKLFLNRSLLRVFLHYMYYNCDIGKNGGV